MSVSLGLVILAFVFSCVQLVIYRRKGARLREEVAKIPGPPDISAPIISNLKSILLYKYATKGQFDGSILVYQEIMALSFLHREHGLFKFWLFNRCLIIVFSAELVESILSNPNQITKSVLYFTLKPWLGEGLVTSEGAKWRSRRRIITPAFHFNILNDFVPAFDAAANKLIKKLNSIKYSASFDISPVVAACTMDIICETAMGVDSDFLSNNECTWGEMVDLTTKFTVARMREPWLWLDSVFYASEIGKKYVKCRDYMHKLSMNVILERRAEWLEKMSASEPDNPGSAWRRMDPAQASLADLSGSASKPKIKMAFLDLMLYQHLVEKKLSIEDIQEEVDTFMFAGQDTTAVTISWTLYLLGLHQEVQDKVRYELSEIFAEEVEKETFDSCSDGMINNTFRLMEVTAESLSKMKYLEMVIRETLRFCPTVPNVSRVVTQDLLLGGKYLIPAGCDISVNVHALHHDPKWFDNPNKYDPDRFLPEICNKRHPYAYVPFSAGPRNCVGQKFAMMEAKLILAKILSNFRVVTTVPFDKLRIHGEVVLKTDTGLFIRLESIH